MSSVVHVLGVIRAHFGYVYHTSRDRHIGDTYITLRLFSLSILACQLCLSLSPFHPVHARPSSISTSVELVVAAPLFSV